KPSKKLCVLTSASTTWLLPTRSNPCEKMAHFNAPFFLPEIRQIPAFFPAKYPPDKAMPTNRHPLI
ncbi:hypothetical protein NL539_22930, partial [Aeromonas sp. CPF2-S1]|nr:hypothetical protein [Aeromonas sp. CPF2-S1]